MAKFKVTLEFEFEADSAEAAEEQFWLMDDLEFMDAAQEADVIVEAAQ